MKIGIIYANLNICGGAEYLAISMIDCLREMQCETLLLSSRKVDTSLIERNFGMKICIDSTIILPLELPKFGTAYWNLFIPSLIRNKCDLILNAYTNNLLPFADITYFHLFKKLGNLTQKHVIKPRFLNPYHWLNFAAQKIQSSHDSHRLILANTNFTAEGIQKLIGIKPLVIYPPVDTEVFSSFSKIEKEKLVVAISRFSPEKNLESLPKISSETDAKFVLIGSVYDAATIAMYRKIMRLIKQYGVENKVAVFPNLSLNGKVALLRKAKVYFHTMQFEDFGISIVEGMAASCIPVVHDSGGPKEFVPKEWRYNDPESASQKIEEALLKWTPSIGNQMAEIAARFSTTEFRQKFSHCFREYLASSHH